MWWRVNARAAEGLRGLDDEEVSLKGELSEGNGHRCVDGKIVQPGLIKAPETVPTISRCQRRKASASKHLLAMEIPLRVRDEEVELLHTCVFRANNRHAGREVLDDGAAVKNKLPLRMFLHVNVHVELPQVKDDLGVVCAA